MRAVVVFALLASLSSCKKKDEGDTKASARPVQVPLAAVQEAQTPVVLTLTGMMAPDQRSEVTADTQGKVISVLVERGQRVKMGQPVVQLDVRNAALSAREAQANLEAARAQKQLAEEECKRTQVLLDKGAITRSEYDRQATQCTATLQQVSAAQARAELSTKSVSDGLVRAPFDGQVTEKSVAPGEWVAPGRTLFTLVDDDPLKIELSVPEAHVPEIQKGQQVDLRTIARPDKHYAATITRIGGEIGKSRSLIVEATLAPQADLVPGMFAEAHVIVGQTRRPVVPSTAVKQVGKLWHAFTAADGELQDRIVQVQIDPAPAPGQVAILQGVKPGEQIVTQLTDQIIDGLRVVQPGANDAKDAKSASAKDAKDGTLADTKATDPAGKDATATTAKAVKE
ncbi:MAG TPA: efflux RND transporter periplasmic adaptor subunit [Kofleriaceae bacterium]